MQLGHRVKGGVRHLVLGDAAQIARPLHGVCEDNAFRRHTETSNQLNFALRRAVETGAQRGEGGDDAAVGQALDGEMRPHTRKLRFVVIVKRLHRGQVDDAKVFLERMLFDELRGARVHVDQPSRRDGLHRERVVHVLERQRLRLLRHRHFFSIRFILQRILKPDGMRQALDVHPERRRHVRVHAARRRARVRVRVPVRRGRARILNILQRRD